MTKSLPTALAMTAFALAALVQTALAAPRGGVEAGARGDPATHRSAKFRGGGGSTWQTGRNTHGFAGSYGGCQYRGFAGPNGYQLKKSC